MTADLTTLLTDQPTSAQPIRAQYDAVIVGSGHNGLIAAAYLARAGKSVLVLERNDYLGGATLSAKVFPEYDAWLSRYAYLVSLLPQQILDDLDLTFETRRRGTASFTPYQNIQKVEQGLLLSNTSQERSQVSMRDLCGNDAGWRSYMEFLQLQQALAEAVWPTLLGPLRTREAFKASLSGNQTLAAWEAFVEQPLGLAIERYAENDLLRGVLLTDGKIGVFTHAHDKSLLQNRCFLYHVIGQGTGEWRVPVGGMRALTSGLVECCQKAGVHFLLNAPAQQVVPGRINSVQFLSDEVTRIVEAKRVLINAGPRTFASLLGDLWKPDEEDEGSVVKVNMLLRRLPRLKAKGVASEEAFAGSLHVDEGYSQMQASYEQAKAGKIPDAPPFEVYCHTLTDSSILSPELQAQGYHTLTLFGLDMPYRLFESEHDSKRDAVLQKYFRALDQICDEPFVNCLARNRNGDLCVEIKTPQDLQRDVDLDLGNIYHNAPSWFYAEDDQWDGKWGVETAYEGILRAGSSAVRGGAVSGIPGRNAAMCILNDKR